jgi:hypothetical protein
LRELLEDQELPLDALIQGRVVDKFILTLKELDLWGLKEYPELNEVHGMIRAKYESLKSLILSDEISKVPLKESTRERIVLKVSQNKAVL